jgi:glucans biosynthesis protein
LERGREHRFQYRLHWGWSPPERSAQASVAQTRLGRSRDGTPFFVLDFANSDTCDACENGPLIPNLSATGGEIRKPQLAVNPAAGGHRLTFEYVPSGAAPADLRCVLTSGGRTASDTWIYRWAP